MQWRLRDSRRGRRGRVDGGEGDLQDPQVLVVELSTEGGVAVAGVEVDHQRHVPGSAVVQEHALDRDGVADADLAEDLDAVVDADPVASRLTEEEAQLDLEASVQGSLKAAEGGCGGDALRAFAHSNSPLSAKERRNIRLSSAEISKYYHIIYKKSILSTKRFYSYGLIILGSAIMNSDYGF